MSILIKAISQLGTKEISGPEDNPQIVQYAKETGIKGIDNDDIAWCSTFVNWCAKKTKLAYTGLPNARSWLGVGITPEHPEPGDVVIFWRESVLSWKGHVGIFMGFNHDASRVFCLGGNQGDTVSITDYDVNKVLGYRRLEEMPKMRVPNPVLKKGSKGKEVIKLQLILNHLKYNCGDTDGDFGTKTKDALKLLQANNLLKMDGEYRNKTKNIIESLLQA